MEALYSVFIRILLGLASFWQLCQGSLWYLEHIKRFLLDVGHCKFVQGVVKIRRIVSLLCIFDAGHHQVHDAFELSLSH